MMSHPPVTALTVLEVVQLSEYDSADEGNDSADGGEADQLLGAQSQEVATAHDLPSSALPDTTAAQPLVDVAADALTF